MMFLVQIIHTEKQIECVKTSREAIIKILKGKKWSCLARFSPKTSTVTSLLRPESPSRFKEQQIHGGERTD